MNLHLHRLKTARAALKTYNSFPGCKPDTKEADITDLVTNLLHLANFHDIDPATIVRRAYEHFEEEHGEREVAANAHGRSVKHAPVMPDPLYNSEGKQIREVTQDELDWTF